MPLLYTASSIQPKRIQNPSFSRRGLDGLTSGRLEQIHHVGVAVEKQIAYDGYITNLPAFLHATAIQSKTSTGAGWYPVKLPLDKLLPIPFPPLVVTSKRGFSNEEDKNQFKLSLGEVVEEIRSPKGMTFVLRNITASQLQKLPYATIDPNTQSPADATSLIGLRSFITTVKIISLFLAVHSYPFKQTPTDTMDRYGNDVAIAWPAGKCFYSHDTEIRGEGNGQVTEAEAMTGNGISRGASLAGASFNSGRHAVFVAKPAPLRPEINYGPPSSTPNFPGYVIPYFPGLIEPSKATIINVVRRFFLGCLAESNDKAGDAWFEWVRGVDKWYQTASGKVVAHILFNIQTALEMQARLFVYIRGGEYLGCSLLGYGSGIMVEGRFVVPETSTEVRSLAGKLDDHGMALERIIGMLNVMRLDKGQMELEVEEITSARKLYKAIRDSPRVGEDEFEELTVQVSKLSFEERLWSAVVSNITRAIDLLTITDPVDDLPMYLDPSLVYNTTRAHEVLSAFGPIAPSFVESVGTDYPIPKGPLADDPASVVDTVSHKRPLEAIYVSLKKLNVAVGDWANVVKKRRIRQNSEKRDAGFRTIEFRGELRDEIWSCLKKIPYDTPSLKRTREVEEGGSDEEGPSTKKGKVRETAVEFTFDDFM
jgi:hypothetical protein